MCEVGDTQKYQTFVAKYDSGGNLLWAQPLLPGSWGNSIATDKHLNIYVVGGTQGALPGNQKFGMTDLSIVKYDPSGSLVWAKQLGSPWGTTEATDVAVDLNLNIYVVGVTSATQGLPGGIQMGPQDAFVAKVDSTGNFLWVRQQGGGQQANLDTKVAIDREGNPYIIGI